MRAAGPSVLPLALGVGGLAVSLASAAPTLGERGVGITSYGGASPGAAVLETLTGAALFTAATLLATDPRRGEAALTTFFLGLAWSGAAWAGWTDAGNVVQNIGRLLLPMVTPAALLVVASLLPRGRTRAAGVSLAGITIFSGVVLWLVRDPFLDRYCWRDCLADSFAPFAEVDRARTATNATLVLGVACGLVTVALCADGFRERIPAAHAIRWALAPGLGAGIVLAFANLALLREPAEDPERSLFVTTFTARGLALTAFAAGLAAVALHPRFVRKAIARLALEPARSAGTNLAASLGHALGDTELQVGYPVSDDLVVDADGQPIAFDEAATRIVRGGELVALVSSASGALPAASLERGLGPAGRLALANERLRAEQLARLRELTELRRRIVAAGDAERRRLERDLHDGAQQRLLALTFDLRVAIVRAEAAGKRDLVVALTGALTCVQEAGGELRTIAHGIFPAVLTTSGLVAAIETLADGRPMILNLNLDSEMRFAPEVETAAYIVVLEGTEGAVDSVRVEIDEKGGNLVVTVDDAPWNGGVVSVEDRVGAAGGTINQSGRRLEAVLPVPPPD